jgi:hypothetical protein
MKTIPRPQPEMAKGDPAQRAGYEGLGSLAGSALLVATPGGSSMQMPVNIMHGAFKDFLIPGIILFWLCVINVVAFFRYCNAKKRTGYRLSWQQEA